MRLWHKVVVSINSNQTGQLLIELLIAIGLTGLILPALLTGIISSQDGTVQEKERLQGTTLLKEANEIVRNIRDVDWDLTATNGSYHPVVAGSSWILVSGSEVIDGFTRELTISDARRDMSGNLIDSGGTVDPSTKKVTSLVSWTYPTSSSVQSTTYLQRYLGNDTLTQTSQADFNPGTKTNTEVTNTAGGEVVLTQTASASLYGNQFRVEGTSAIGNMTANNMKTALRFTAQSSKTVNSIRVYLNNEVGTSPTYRFGIQANNAGNPSGVYLGSGTQVNTSPGWKTITLSPAVTLTAGSVYHLVVEHQSGAISTARYIALRASTPLNNLVPHTNNADAQANTLFNNGSGWAVQNSQPIYELDFSDSTFEGNPYETTTATSIFGANFIGERILITGQSKVVSDVSFYVRRNSATNPADSLRVVLQDADTGTVVEEGILATAAQTTTSYQYLTYTFTTPRTLAVNTNYRIYLKAPAANSTNFYQVYRVSGTNAANYNSINFEGTSSFYTNSTNSGGSWSTTNVNFDIGGFYFSVQGAASYQPSGTFESTSLDASDQAAFNYLTWGATVPGGTSLQLQVAVNSDNATWDYFGEDGTGSSYFTTPKAIPLSQINGRYLRYRVYFTSDGTVTPTLQDVTLNYSP